MGLVAWPTLALRITQGAVGLDQAAGIAKQIADVLEAAPREGNRAPGSETRQPQSAAGRHGDQMREGLVDSNS